MALRNAFTITDIRNHIKSVDWAGFVKKKDYCRVTSYFFGVDGGILPWTLQTTGDLLADEIVRRSISVTHQKVLMIKEELNSTR